MKKLLFAFAIVALAFSAVPAQADDITLTDGNSVAVISPGSQSGMHSWTVDGVSQLYQQWFWYRVGDTGGESSIDSLGLANVQKLDTVAILTYSGNGLEVKITYTLAGGAFGSGQSDVDEQIKVTNTGRSAIDLHFFQYSDFDLNGTSGNQSVQFAGVNYNTVSQTGLGAVMSETVLTGNEPVAHEASVYNDLLASLNDSSPTTLSNANSAFGDVIWAYEWNASLGSGHSLVISKDKALMPIPEPGSMLLLGSGLFGLAGAVRRRMKK